MWDIIWLSSETEPLDEVCVQLTQKSEFFDTSAIHFFLVFYKITTLAGSKRYYLLQWLIAFDYLEVNFDRMILFYKKIQSQRDAKGKYRLNEKYALILRRTKGTHLIE